jgi:hypothetical protein
MTEPKPAVPINEVDTVGSSGAPGNAPGALRFISCDVYSAILLWMT